MADVASMFLLKALIAKNKRMLDGRSPPPRGVSLYAIHKENIRLREVLARHEADIAAAKAAKRKRLPYPSDLSAQDDH
jgi:hypothetical protein